MAHAMKGFKINEISSVDRAAQKPAKALLIKRDDSLEQRDGESREDYAERLFKNANLVLTTDEDGHAHLLDASEQGGMTSHALSEGSEDHHAHPWVRDSQGNIVIGASDGHTHEAMMNKRESSEGGSEESAGDVGGGQVSKGESMSDKTKPTAGDQEAVEKLEKVTAELQFAKAYGRLTDAGKAHYEKLDDEGKDSFLKLDAEAQERELSKAQEADAIVYEADNGDVYRKSDDPRLVKMAKERDEDRKLLKAERTLREQEQFEKRGREELGNLPGEDNIKAAVVKAIDGIEDETLRTGARALLKAGNESIGHGFETFGVEGGSTVNKGDAESRYEQLALDFAKRHDVDIVKARADVLSTPEGAAVYAEMKGARTNG